jgi:hypothetical protein
MAQNPHFGYGSPYAPHPQYPYPYAFPYPYSYASPQGSPYHPPYGSPVVKQDPESPLPSKRRHAPHYVVKQEPGHFMVKRESDPHNPIVVTLSDDSEEELPRKAFKSSSQCSSAEEYLDKNRTLLSDIFHSAKTNGVPWSTIEDLYRYEFEQTDV